ncbi:hypothetical protein [Actinoplanes sp. NPDC051851]|uniref:hypothetical protein n=1 Tax=Actinoplanes sp. NPDC051851 TaxID=3154753 RepID=UPI00342A4B77
MIGRPELGTEADDVTAESVPSRHDVDRTAFAAEYPEIGGAAEPWLQRLALTLDRS